MVESGKGVTFIPELALYQLDERQRSLVRPFAIPIPTRDVIMLTAPSFIRRTLLNLLVSEIQASVPKELLTLNNTQQRI